MFLKNQNYLITRFVLILAFLAGMLGTPPVGPAYAATILVTNTSNSGPGSLRQAIADAVSGDTITFSALLAGQTITLSDNLIIDKGLTIDGSGLVPQITISGRNVAHLEVLGSDAVTISDLIITNGYTSIYGGGIYKSGPAALTIQNSTITQSQASGGGAISNTGSGNMTIINTTIVGNEAGQGGAIDNIAQGDIIIVNSTVTENQATLGGAIAIGGSDLRVYNSTFALNLASREGNELSTMGIVNINFYNTILACIPGAVDCTASTESTSIEYVNSIVDYGTLTDFGLAELADNGGPTHTMSLLPGSPLIDAADDANCPTTDQRGITRPQGNHCDIGAYESQTSVIYVKQDATGENNGASWTDAYTDLQSALADASSGDEIWVVGGTYKPGNERTSTFSLIDGVAVYGGFAGTET
jgi:hypothetical protein